MDNCIIRYALSADYKPVETIFQQMHTMHVEWRPDWYKPCDPLLTPEQFEDLVRKQRLLLAEVDGRVAGVLNFEFRYISSPREHPQHLVRIEAMAVHKKFRTKPIVGAFLDHIREFAKKNYHPDIQIELDARNAAVYDLLLHFGFMEKSVVLEWKQFPSY